MKKSMAILFVFVCVTIAFSGTVLAAEAPSAMSYFTNPNASTNQYICSDTQPHT